MKRKYKLMIIILISGILTYLIYIFNKEEKIKLVAIGDGIASGETSYNIDGISYNDYLKEYFEDSNQLKHYSSDYSIKNYKIDELIQDIKANTTRSNKLNINQLLNKANIITISIGEEELVKLSITKDLKEETILNFINKYDALLSIIGKESDASIFIIGFYENKYLSKSDVIILNSELSNIALKYKVNFINIMDIMLDSNYLDKNEYYFNYKGHKVIADMILNSL